MMDKAKFLIFDLDGTLVDTSRDLTQAINLTLHDFNLPPLGQSFVTKHIGFGVKKLLENQIEDSEKALRAFERHYSSCLVEHSVLYPGMRELLTDTSFEKVILTNKMSCFLEPLLAALDLRHFFSGVYGLEAFPTSKPDPGPVLEISRIHGVDLNQIILIGDTEADIKAGQAAGVQTCAVEWGYADSRVLQALSPTKFVSSSDALFEFLNSPA